MIRGFGIAKSLSQYGVMQEGVSDQTMDPVIQMPGESHTIVAVILNNITNSTEEYF